jgi:putative ABC transport system permease protein
MTTLINDINYALRQLRKRPGFAATVITILALGIGANTAVFSVVYTVLFKALPYDKPDGIVRIWEHDKSQGIEKIKSSHRNILYWREHNQVFEHIAGVRTRRAYLTGLDKSYRLQVSKVSSCFFSVMGVQPMLGRSFLPEEERPGDEHVMILSYPFWRDRMGRDPQALGKTLTLDNESYTIIGIMPPDFRESLHRDIPFWVPLVLDPKGIGGGTMVWARLKQGVTLAQAQAEMSILEERLVQKHQDLAGKTATVTSFLNEELGDNRTLLYLLWGAVGLVLLMTCVNATGLFLAHGSVRRRELAVRSALGASRLRIVQQILTEGFVVSIVAGGVGVLMAIWVIRILVGMCPGDIPRITETRVNAPVLLFSLSVTLLTGLVFSLLPAWKSLSVQVNHILKAGSSEPTFRRRWTCLRSGLVVSQIGIAMTLLMGAGLLIQSLIAMQQVDLGFKPDNVLVASIELPKVKYPEISQWLAFYQSLLQRVQVQPGVQCAALVSGILDLGSGGGSSRHTIDEKPLPDSEKPRARTQVVSCDFFQAMGIRILKGRSFTDQDTLAGPQAAVIIDDNFARKYFPKEDPIGQHINGTPIVGVAATLKDFKELSPGIVTIYKPVSEFCYLLSDLVVKTQGNPLRLADVIRSQVSALDKDLEIAKIQTLESTLAEMLAPRRFTTILLGLFAKMALILAVVGLFGLLQYTVTHSTRDIGIRMALGATDVRITCSFLRQGIGLILAGIGMGLLGGYAVSRAVTSLLFRSGPTDPSMLAVIIGALFSVTLLACYVPARRAAKVDPMEALRYE